MKCPKRKMHSEMYPVKSVHGPGHLVLDDVEGENQSEGGAAGYPRADLLQKHRATGGKSKWLMGSQTEQNVHAPRQLF